MGEKFEHEDIRQGSIPFNLINSEFLARLLMGCLWPDPESRFTVEKYIELVKKRDEEAEYQQTVDVFCKEVDVAITHAKERMKKRNKLTSTYSKTMELISQSSQLKEW